MSSTEIGLMDKEYIQPEIKVVTIKTRATILAGSFPDGFETPGGLQEGGTDGEYY